MRTLISTTRRRLGIPMALAIALMAPCSSTVEAAIITFEGQDADGSLTNANAAFADLVAAASPLTTEDFESLAAGPYTVANLPGVVVSAPGINGSFDVFDGPIAGAFPISGSGHIGNRHETNEILFTFDQPINAFGIFATDLDGESVTVRFDNGALQQFLIPNVGSNGSDAFFGYVDTSSSTTAVSVSDSGLFVTYDDVSFRVIPEPSTALLLGGGLLALAVGRKRRTGSRRTAARHSLVSS